MDTRFPHELAVKGGLPAGVSVAHLAGFDLPNLILWGTLFYTILIIGHKLWTIYREIKVGITK